MKLLNVFGIVISIVLCAVSFYYIDEVSSSRYTNDEYKIAYNFYNNITISSQAILVTILLSVFFVVLYVINLISIKTKTTKVLSIIGLSVSFMLIVWGVMGLTSGGRITFDEIGYIWVFYAILCFSFSIVFYLQANKTLLPNNDVLDDIEFN